MDRDTLERLSKNDLITLVLAQAAQIAAVYWCCDRGEAVLYRHLRKLNMARILGWAAASGGTAPPADGAGLEPLPVMFRHWNSRLVVDAALLPAPGGLLTIRSDQIEGLNARRVSASHRRIAAYLRAIAPAEIDGASAGALEAHALTSERSGRALGIATEPGHARWAFLMAQTRGRIFAMPAALAAIRRPGAAPDENVRQFMDGAIAELRLRVTAPRSS